LTPFTALDPSNELPGHSRTGRWLIRQLARRGAAVYPAQTQVAYKLKWQPDIVQPEYVGFQGRLSMGAVWQLLRLTGAVPFGLARYPGSTGVGVGPLELGC
jgi:hypothetical protein